MASNSSTVQDLVKIVSTGHTGRMPDENVISNAVQNIDGSGTWNATLIGRRLPPAEGNGDKVRGDTDMHHSRLCALLIDCRTTNVDDAARFWAQALGRPVDPAHPGTRGNYRMLETPPDEPIVQIQRVDHDSRVHIDIETDDISAEVTRLEKLGAKVADRLERWVVMQAPTGQRFCVVREQRPGFPRNANRWS